MEPMEQAKRPITGLAGRYGHPLHPALVALPIGAWVASFVFDLGSHAAGPLGTDPQVLAEGARWLIALGVIGAVTAAMVGFLDLLGLPPGTPVFRTGLAHLSLALAATAAYAVGFGWRGADPAAPVPPGPLALSGAALLLLGAAGYLGGRLAYRYGVRVADETTQSAGYQLRSSPDPKETP